MKKVISFVSRFSFSGTTYSLLLFGFLGLGFLNTPRFLPAVPVTSSAPDSSPVSSSASSSFSDELYISDPTTTTDSSSISWFEKGVLVYKTKFMFAHSSEAFDGIKSLSEGGRVIVSRDGETEFYQVAIKKTMTLSEATAYYSAISERVQYRGKTYDLALMTCGDGTFGTDGNNNAFRTFVFATRIE